jgi:hypothetical protein
MSLHVYLEDDATEFNVASDLLEERGFLRAAQCLRKHAGEVLYEANITHNLNTMAEAAGIYQALWRPEEVGITHASQLVEPLSEGLFLLQSDPARFEVMNPSNGWGDYDGLVKFVADYLEAAKEHPQALVRADR